MSEFEFREEDIPVFQTVGELRELLKDYTDDTPLVICGVPGMFFPNKKDQCILLEVHEGCGYEVIHDIMEELWEQEHMDF